MLVISGIVTNHGRYTPNPTADNPAPQTYHTLGIEGVNVSFPDANTVSKFPVGSEVQVPVLANRAPNGGFKFRYMPVQL